MKKYAIFVGVVFMVLSVFAIPAKKGIKKNLSLADGTYVTVTLCGDEYCHYWLSEDGRRFNIDDNQLVTEITTDEYTAIHAKATERKQAANKVRANRLPAANKTLAKVGSFSNYEGKKKGLVILVNFQDLTFSDSDSIAQARQDSMFNQVGYSENSHIGSVHDYYYDQSYGRFELSFDVVGPVTLSHIYTYYGRNNSFGNDAHPCEMVIEACNLVDSLVDFSDYDWDGDGSVEQVYLVYAGHGEHAGADKGTIWPHEYQLSSGEVYGDGTGAQFLDSVLIDTYAVSCELEGANGNTLSGIGTACHEFSHCLGYPDFYDTDYSGGWGMKSWDILDQGSYNGPTYNGEVPAGYTSYERWMAGWLTPTELKAGDTVESLYALNDSAQAYIIYNDSVPTEYYLLENRAPSRWFSYIQQYKTTRPGLLVLHVDYDEDVWAQNGPNNDPAHQRMTIVPANNQKNKYMNASLYDGNLYPYNQNDSLTNLSTPATDTYNKNKSRKKFLPLSVNGITVNEDCTISFNATETYFEPVPVPVIADSPVDTLTDDIIFYETFNRCKGKGGNDGKWSGSIATSALLTDSVGWSSGFGAYQCARFGTVSKAASVTSPTINYKGDVKISFKAAAWNYTKDGTDLTVSINDDDILNYTMSKGDWTTYSFYYTLNGPTILRFDASLRMFLDDVGIAKSDPTAIEEVSCGLSSAPHSSSLYNIAGQKVSSEYQGIIIINGRKILNIRQ